MALIKCVECGKEISDKSKACINCGCPIEYSITALENSLNHVNEVQNLEKLAQDNEFWIEIISCGNSRMKLAEFLSSVLKLKFREVMENLEHVPFAFKENVDEKVYNMLLEEIEDVEVEYRLIKNGKIIKSNFNKEIETSNKMSTPINKNERFNVIPDRTPEKENDYSELYDYIWLVCIFLVLCFFSYVQ